MRFRNPLPGATDNVQGIWALFGLGSPRIGPFSPFASSCKDG